MKLDIRQTTWAVGYKPAARGIRCITHQPYRKPVECAVGTELTLGSNACAYSFVIEEVGEDSITLAHYARNEKYNQKWLMHIGETVFYRTRTTDAGFNFYFTLKK